MGIQNNTKELEKSYKTLLKTAIVELISKEALSEKSAKSRIDDYVYKRGRLDGISIERCIQLSEEIFNSMYKLDVLQQFIDDDSISEIMVNGCEQIIIERQGKIEFTEFCFESKDTLMNVIQTIVSKVNRRVNLSNPIVDARLNDGSRIHVVLQPIALNGPILTIRKFNNIEHNMVSLLNDYNNKTELNAFFERLIRCKYNIFVSGGTSSGKTTFLNALSGFIKEDERIITIEDSAELNLRHIRNLVTLETKNANAEGDGAITMDMLIRASLRMRPDRIIVGEVRGPEALEMLNAMNTGHDGSLSTGHANSAIDMLKRLELMVLKNIEIPNQVLIKLISASIDIVIHLERDVHGNRRIMEIVEILSSETNYDVNKLYKSKNNQLVFVNPLKRVKQGDI